LIIFINQKYKEEILIYLLTQNISIQFNKYNKKLYQNPDLLLNYINKKIILKIIFGKIIYNKIIMMIVDQEPNNKTYIIRKRKIIMMSIMKTNIMNSKIMKISDPNNSNSNLEIKNMIEMDLH
jgi:hypothetical protein